MDDSDQSENSVINVRRERRGWWTYLSVASWLAGVAYLFFHLKWGKPNDHPWTRLTSALTLKELVLTIVFFAAALLIHHHAHNPKR